MIVGPKRVRTMIPTPRLGAPEGSTSQAVWNNVYLPPAGVVPARFLWASFLWEGSMFVFQSDSCGGRAEGMNAIPPSEGGRIEKVHFMFLSSQGLTAALGGAHWEP